MRLTKEELYMLRNRFEPPQYDPIPQELQDFERGYDNQLLSHKKSRVSFSSLERKAKRFQRKTP